MTNIILSTHRRAAHILLILAVFLAAGPLAGQQGGRFADLIDKAARQGGLRVIVGLNVEATGHPLLQQFALSRARADLLNALGQERAAVVAMSDRWRIPYLALAADSDALRKLAASPLVASISEDAVSEPLLAETTDLIDAPEAWAFGLDGSGSVVAILDSGIDNAHPFFQDRVVYEACFSTNGTIPPYGLVQSLCPNGETSQTGSGAAGLSRCTTLGANCNHGTHVAGIAAGGDGQGGHPADGVARGADLIAVQVFSYLQDCNTSTPGDQPGVCSFTSDQISALNHLFSISGAYDIAAVNMSLGGGSYSSQATCDSANSGIKAAIDQLRSAAIATIAASGNSGLLSSISAPACISSAVAVGAVSDGDAVTYYSNQNAIVDLLAPGGSPSSGTRVESSLPGGGYGLLYGTSMAAPHAAGAWAILKQTLPTLTVDQTLALLQDGGALVSDAVRDNGTAGGGLSYKRIDLDGALSLLISQPPELATPLDDAFSGDTTPTLTWQAAPGALSYVVQMATDDAFASLVSGYPVMTANLMLYSPTLAPATRYYWRVASVNGYGYQSEFSPARVLNLSGAPSAHYWTTTSVTLTWNFVSWADQYRVQVDDDPTFASPVPKIATDLEAAFDLPGPGTYYWRVRAEDENGGAGPWSATETFVVATP